MIAPNRLPVALAATFVFSLIIFKANAQQLSCDNLQRIIKVVASDSALTAIRGAEVADKYDKAKHYTPIVSLWVKSNEFSSEFIKYDDDRHTFAYNTMVITEGTSGKGEARGMLAEFRKCLGNNWVLKNDVNRLGDSVYYLKSPADFVVIKIYASDDNDFVELYNESKKGDECILGNCDSNFGAKQFFNEDVYSGTFIEGGVSGMGSMKFYSNGSTYQGSFIDDQIAGYGSVYNEKNELVQSGIFFKGQVVAVDTTKKGCQFGNCENGFGLKVMDGGYYVGNFKNSLLDGLGELVLYKTYYYGNFTANQTNGKGILINKEGDYIFGDYKKGRLSGEFEWDYINKTSKEANAETGKGSLFDEDNILIKSGTWAHMQDAAFTENTGADYIELQAFVKALKEFYGYRATGYKQIRGEENKMLKLMGAEGYKSKVLFRGMYGAYISTDKTRHYYVRLDLSGPSTDKAKAIAMYNKYYVNFAYGVGSRWTAVTDDGAADAVKTKANVVLQNMFDKSKIISLSINGSNVTMEIH
ncbi:hypothetical protein [Mucilaginibacter sp.]|uniref:hypothetical protein n=1 Tax=Mucilaginibacter sp. TaxID=1882438 RepID=UPI0025CD132A|nr:hypothetical protein [Mucilaginibacter sp.]